MLNKESDLNNSVEEIGSTRAYYRYLVIEKKHRNPNFVTVLSIRASIWIQMSEVKHSAIIHLFKIHIK